MSARTLCVCVCVNATIPLCRCLMYTNISKVEFNFALKRSGMLSVSTSTWSFLVTHQCLTKIFFHSCRHQDSFFDLVNSCMQRFTFDPNARWILHISRAAWFHHHVSESQMKLSNLLTLQQPTNPPLDPRGGNDCNLHLHLPVLPPPILPTSQLCYLPHHLHSSFFTSASFFALIHTGLCLSFEGDVVSSSSWFKCI